MILIFQKKNEAQVIYNENNASFIQLTLIGMSYESKENAHL